MVCQFGAGKNKFVTGGERQVNDDGGPPVLDSGQYRLEVGGAYRFRLRHAHGQGGNLAGAVDECGNLFAPQIVGGLVDEPEKVPTPVGAECGPHRLVHAIGVDNSNGVFGHGIDQLGDQCRGGGGEDPIVYCGHGNNQGPVGVVRWYSTSLRKTIGPVQSPNKVGSESKRHELPSFMFEHGVTVELQPIGYRV